MPSLSPKTAFKAKNRTSTAKRFTTPSPWTLQKHLLEDAGATAAEIEAVSEPVYELAFEAAGVMIADVPAGAPMAGDE